LKERPPAFRPSLPLSGVLGFGQHDQRTGEFLGCKCIGPGGDHQFTELLHLAVFQVSRLVFERLQFRVEVGTVSL
jgi:hypothetical protein